MDKFYYLVAQLPMLFFAQKPPLLRESFLQEARKWLSPAEYSFLASLDMNDTQIFDNDSRLARTFKRFEYQFRSELVQWRKSRREGQEYKPVSFPGSLLKDATPLEVEKRLLRFRWDFLEDHEYNHHFDLDFLVLYFLKLQILQRLFSFDKEKGWKKFQITCEVTP